MTQARLITIAISHYCEKARWVLDATGLPYREEAHAPVLHRRATRAVGGTTVPVLVDGNDVACDSVDIARHAERLAPPARRLVPEEPQAREEVLVLEGELSKTLGVDARLLAYWFMLRDMEVARPFVGRMMRVRSPALQRVVVPLFRALIFRAYGVSREAAVRAEARTRATFERLGGRIEEGGYLVGGRFSLADLTLASLASPLLGPPEHPITGKRTLAVAPGLAALRGELVETPVGRHALRMYREHRGVKRGA
jgi:glutathione S-transferase